MDARLSSWALGDCAFFNSDQRAAEKLIQSYVFAEPSAKTQTGRPDSLDLHFSATSVSSACCEWARRVPLDDLGFRCVWWVAVVARAACLPVTSNCWVGRDDEMLRRSRAASRRSIGASSRLCMRKLCTDNKSPESSALAPELIS